MAARRCRRIAEYRIRALVRRIDRIELEIRELKAGDLGALSFMDDDERRQALRLKRRWLAEDQSALRAMLGGSQPSSARRASSTNDESLQAKDQNSGSDE